MAILWPSTLPVYPLYEGYSESAPNTTLRSAMSTGPAKVRPKCAALPWGFTVSFYLTSAQVEELKTFIYTTLSNGALRFEWTHPRTMATIESRVLGGDNMYQVTPSGRGWNVVMQFEVMP